MPLAGMEDTHDQYRPVGPTEKEPLLSGAAVVVKHPPKRCYIPARYIVTCMAFLGFFNVYAMRVNLSVALVAMVKSTGSKVNVTDACPQQNNHTSDPQEGPYDWNPVIQGQILSSFFYGYILTQIPGGLIAGRYGAKWPFAIGVFCTTLLTLLTPVVADISPFALMVLRFMEGLGEGVTYPSAHALFAKWSPPLERSKLLATTYSGAYCGTAVFLPVAGILCSGDLLGGWPSVFYISGVMGMVWLIFWCLLVSSTPASHPCISDEELEYITSSLEDKQEILDTPWRSILTSGPVWSIAVAHFCATWSFYTLLTDLPTYFRNILNFDIAENGVLSSLPYVCSWLVTAVVGQLADLLRSRGVLSTGATRKTLNFLGFFLQGCFLIGAALAGCNITLAVGCLIGTVGSGGIMSSGFNVNHVDIAPRYAGVLMGITNTAATIPGFLGPAVVSVFTSQSQDKQSWFKIFAIAAGFDVVGILVFQIFGSGVQQEWAKDRPQASINDPGVDDKGPTPGDS